jgi:hypothetical protein
MQDVTDIERRSAFSRVRGFGVASGLSAVVAVTLILFSGPGDGLVAACYAVGFAVLIAGAGVVLRLTPWRDFGRGVVVGVALAAVGVPALGLLLVVVYAASGLE